MKIVRMEQNARAPGLWEFARRNGPKSIIGATKWEGYSAHYDLSVQEHRIAEITINWIPEWMRSLLGACAFDEIVEVTNPTYLSDVQKIVAEYETETKKMVLVKYWEAV